MALDDNESCGSRATESPKRSRQHRQRFEVFNEVLGRLHHLNCDEVKLPGFADQLWNHFNRLPSRYALDVNVERAEDVLTHKRLLDQARDPQTRPIFQVRLVQVQPTNDDATDSDQIDSPMREQAQSRYNNQSSRNHPPPTFGSSPNLEALALHANNEEDDGHFDSTQHILRPMHDITFSSIDMPKLLSQLTAILSELGLNIEEAHAFSTTDGFSLDVFVVHGWPYE